MSSDRFMLVNSSNQMICEGIVKEYFRGDAEFQVIHGQEVIKQLAIGCYVRFVFLEGRRGVFEGELVDIQKNRLTLENIRSLAGYVKEDIRIDVEFMTKVFAKDLKGDISSWKVEIKDVSAGGVRLQCNQHIPLNRVVELAVPYHSSYVVVDMVLLREELIETEEKRCYEYGCKFYDLTNTEEQMVRSMVFQIAAKKAGKTGGLS